MLSKKSLLNLALFFIVASLAGFIYLSDEVTTDLALLTDRQAGTIHTIAIRNNKTTTIIERSSPTQWQLSQPINIAANNFRINSILNLLHAPVHTKYPATSVDLDKLGLLNSGTSIDFDDITILFGITNPATNLRFVQLADTVYTIEDVYYPFFNSHFGTLVSLNLLPADSAISKLILLNQTIAKDEAGLWRSNITISTDKINAVIENWKNLQAFGVHEYIKRESLGEVFIFTADRKTALTFVITDTDPWLIIARPDLGLEYHLDIGAYDKLIAPR